MVRKDNTVKITSDKITKDYAEIDEQSLNSMVLYKFKRYAAIIECISHAVGKTADDEQRNSEKKRKIALLACKCYRSCHHETARDTEKETTERTSLESEGEDSLRSSLNIKR